MAWLFVLPAIFIALLLVTRKHIFSTLITLSCALIALLAHAPYCAVPAIGLIASAAGDHFMSLRHGRDDLYQFGIIGFLMGHLCFILYALFFLEVSAFPVMLGIALTALYAVYLRARILPGLPHMLRAPAIAYMVVSIMCLMFALMAKRMAGQTPFAIGILCIVCSDTMIAEYDFAGNQRLKPLVLPAYYLCHILLAASTLVK